ncbi:MAG: hypothetical protein RIR82_343, partial [Pseudomonadota bacterium]
MRKMSYAKGMNVSSSKIKKTINAS